MNSAFWHAFLWGCLTQTEQTFDRPSGFRNNFWTLETGKGRNVTLLTYEGLPAGSRDKSDVNRHLPTFRQINTFLTAPEIRTVSFRLKSIALYVKKERKEGRKWERKEGSICKNECMKMKFGICHAMNKCMVADWKTVWGGFWSNFLFGYWLWGIYLDKIHKSIHL